MTAIDVPHAAHRPVEPARLLAPIGLALALGYATFLFGALLQGEWLVDANGAPVANDFVGLWSAGRLALDGHPAAAYDWTLHRAAVAAAVGHPLDSFYPWSYPPPFLFVAAAMALMPVVPAAILWLALTASAYVAAIRAIVGARAGPLFACGFPGALWTITAGQNGFLTAALMGASLTLMRRQPWLAGACLGLMTCKPQLGLLFPLVLAITGRWRMFASAAIVAGMLAALSAVAFGSAPWQAFVDSAAAMQRLNFTLGGAGWAKWQSLFGFVRWLGGSEPMAWAIHGSFAGACAIAISALWTSRAPFQLKAAALAVGSLIATPYLFIYDLVVLAVPTAFLVRHAITTGFLRSEVIGLCAAGALLLAYVVMPSPVGLAAILIVAALIARRSERWFVRDRGPAPHTRKLFATG